MYPGTEAIYMGDPDSPLPELPTVPGAFEALAQSMQKFIAKLETVDIDAMGDDILGILSGVDDLLNKPMSEATVTDLQASLRALRGLLQQVDEAGVDAVVISANRVLGNADKTLSMLNDVLSPNAPLQYNLIRVTGELEETAKSIRSLINILERRPQSLIFGPGTINEGAEGGKKNR
jgi:paraquat-inducible protein B